MRNIKRHHHTCHEGMYDYNCHIDLHHPHEIFLQNKCKCCGEFEKEIESFENELNSITARIVRDEDTIKDNYNYFVEIIGQLSQNQSKDITDVYLYIDKKDTELFDSLSNRIGAEEQRAQNKENAIQNQLNTYISTNDKALQQEISRASSQESKIDSKLNNYIESNDSALAAEINRAKAEESTLKSTKANASDVYTREETYTKDQIEAKIRALINAAPEALDTLGEIANKLKDNDSVVSAIINSITTEANNRANADSTINARIDSYVSDHDSDIARLYSALSTEQTRATTAETAIQSNLDKYRDSHDAAIAAEISRATTAEQAIRDSIPTTLKNPYSISWSGYSTGSYDGSAGANFSIPNNTNQLENGAGYTTTNEVSNIINNALQSVYSSIESINSAINNLNTNITSLNNSITEINQKLGSAEQNITTLQTTVNEIQNNSGDSVWTVSGGYAVCEYPAKAAGFYDSTL